MANTYTLEEILHLATRAASGQKHFAKAWPGRLQQIKATFTTLADELRVLGGLARIVVDAEGLGTLEILFDHLPDGVSLNSPSVLFAPDMKRAMILVTQHVAGAVEKHSYKLEELDPQREREIALAVLRRAVAHHFHLPDDQ